MHDLEDDLGELCERFGRIKNEVRRRDPALYERWKAGGFLVDDDIYSMYPNVTEVVDQLLGSDEKEEEESDGDQA